MGRTAGTRVTPPPRDLSEQEAEELLAATRHMYLNPNATPALARLVADLVAWKDAMRPAAQRAWPLSGGIRA